MQLPNLFQSFLHLSFTRRFCIIRYGKGKVFWGRTGDLHPYLFIHEKFIHEKDERTIGFRFVWMYLCQNDKHLITNSIHFLLNLHLPFDSYRKALR